MRIFDKENHHIFVSAPRLSSLVIYTVCLASSEVALVRLMILGTADGLKTAFRE
jgi:tRNA U34 5-carboxymethylaminomethyl modifying enzyme MnmG/GidA